MIYNDIFVSKDLPKLLEEEELIKLFQEYENGNVKVRDKIVEHNIKLVLNNMFSFDLYNYDEKDILSIGLIGLIKAVDTFDLKKNIKFSTYATTCIRNEILFYFRKNNKYLTDIKFMKETDNPISIESIIGNNEDLDDILENYILRSKIRNYIEKLKDRNKIIIKLYFGFYNNKLYKQNEIAKMFNLNQSVISRVIKKELEEIKEAILNDDYFDEYKKLVK